MTTYQISPAVVRAELWQPRHVLGSAVLATIGTVGMVVCWYVGAGKRTYGDEVPWLVGSVACAGVVVLGGVYWLVCGFRQVTLLQGDLMRYLAPWQWEAQSARPTTEIDYSAAAFVVAPGMRRAHRPQCLMTRGKKDLQALSGADVAARGLSGCGACGA